jgi:hypothetical protein
MNQILAEQRINDYKLYRKSLNEEDTIALKVAEEVFGKNFRIEETVGYIVWKDERNYFQGEYLKAITNLNYAMEHQRDGDEDDDYYMTEEGILTENDDDDEMPEDATPDINYFSNANIERITEIITDLLEDEDLWDELDYNTKPIIYYILDNGTLTQCDEKPEGDEYEFESKLDMDEHIEITYKIYEPRDSTDSEILAAKANLKKVSRPEVSSYMEELIECFKCETNTKRKDMGWRDYGYLDVCKKCDQKTQDSVGGSGDKKKCVGCCEDFDIQWLYSRDGVDGLLCEECYDDAMLDADEEDTDDEDE